VIAFIFALGNLWRFPSQLAENGGLAYLVPYLVLFFLTALPILLLESALGQLVRLGPLSVRKICPLFKVKVLLTDLLSFLMPKSLRELASRCW